MAVKIGNFEIKSYGLPYIIAEMGSNHNGKPEKAQEMIDRAVECGCNCVKFQSWTSDTLYSKQYYAANPIAKRMVDTFSFSEGQLASLAAYCRKAGIDFSSTPYSKREIDFLAGECGAPFIKIASMDLNNYPFLEYAASKGLPVVLSTGMSDLEEIRRAVKTVGKTGFKELCLLHCVAEYPPKTESVNLNNICLLQKEFPECPVGFSDHTPGTDISSAAVALGSCIIEKHFTLDKSLPGWDNKMAMEPHEMAQLVTACRKVCIATGTFERIVEAGELEQRKNIRRSVVAARDLKAGTVLAAEDLDAKRPGTGYPPEKIAELIGAVLTRDISFDEMLIEEDFK